MQTIGIDLAKTVFQLHAVDADGATVVRKRLRRVEVLSFESGLAPCLIGMEACATSHFWARELAKFGHSVKLMPPGYVKPYVKRGKNDATDAEAICEAASRPNMRFVPVKNADQQAVEKVFGEDTSFIGAESSVPLTLGPLTLGQGTFVWTICQRDQSSDTTKFANRLASNFECLA